LFGDIGVSTAGEKVRQLRLVVAVEDFDEAVAFYRDVLGMPEDFYVESEGGARVIALEAGATVEIINRLSRPSSTISR
jgi:catechol 2,3-dioxygenase-like lactoylglutathione lyase family enzyme